MVLIVLVLVLLLVNRRASSSHGGGILILERETGKGICQVQVFARAGGGIPCSNELNDA